MGNCGSAKQKPGAANGTAPPQNMGKPIAQTPRSQAGANPLIESKKGGATEKPLQSARATSGPSEAAQGGLVGQESPIKMDLTKARSDPPKKAPELIIEKASTPLKQMPSGARSPRSPAVSKEQKQILDKVYT